MLFSDYINFISYIVIQLLELVECMHSMNIMHRDLNPSNIMIVSYNNPKIKLIDFGLAANSK